MKSKGKSIDWDEIERKQQKKKNIEQKNWKHLPDRHQPFPLCPRRQRVHGFPALPRKIMKNIDFRLDHGIHLTGLRILQFSPPP
jgi:hypothetical protein